MIDCHSVGVPGLAGPQNGPICWLIPLVHEDLQAARKDRESHFLIVFSNVIMLENRFLFLVRALIFLVPNIFIGYLMRPDPLNLSFLA